MEPGTTMCVIPRDLSRKLSQFSCSVRPSQNTTTRSAAYWVSLLLQAHTFSLSALFPYPKHISQLIQNSALLLPHTGLLRVPHLPQGLWICVFLSASALILPFWLSLDFSSQVPKSEFSCLSNVRGQRPTVNQESIDQGPNPGPIGWHQGEGFMG